MGENWSRRQSLFEPSKCDLAVVSPVEIAPLLGKSCITGSARSAYRGTNFRCQLVAPRNALTAPGDIGTGAKRLLLYWWGWAATSLR